ncbi:MAG: inositol monophosphatase [Fuerstiella sp.]|nr:inositol monophosphatase [Fuerstiella sp.]
MTIARTALRAAQIGGEVLMKYFRQGVAMRHKGPVDLVSDADVESEQAIAEVIRETYPDHSLLGEEGLSVGTSTENLWVIDPLDGTTNFAHDIPHFAVSIGYYHNGVAQQAVVFNPARNDSYTAERGRGAFHNGRPIRVSAADTMNDVLIGVGFYYDRGSMMEATLAAVKECFGHQIHGIRRMGTASLDLAQVASGQYGAFFEYQLSAWDFAAGRLLVEEAGGRITTCHGTELSLEKTSVLACNAKLYDTVCEITSRHHP